MVFEFLSDFGFRISDLGKEWVIVIFAIVSATWSVPDSSSASMQEIDPDLEMAEIHRRVYEVGGPALLFTRVKGCSFPMASNLFGTPKRIRYLFRDALRAVRHLVELKVDPRSFWKNPWRYRDVPGTLLHTLPRMVKTVRSSRIKRPSVSCRSCEAGRCDGGAFITLPQVYTEDVDHPGWRHSNLGMYRVQLSGNRYEPDRQVGLHYQIHRGIGVHHAAALRRGVPLRVNVIVGGPPALALAAVMPLPEGMPELAFAGALGGRRIASSHPVRQRPASGLVTDQPAGEASRLTPAVRPNCRYRPRRISASRAPSIRSGCCRKDRSAIISAITVWSTISRC